MSSFAHCSSMDTSWKCMNKRCVGMGHTQTCWNNFVLRQQLNILTRPCYSVHRHKLFLARSNICCLTHIIEEIILFHNIHQDGCKKATKERFLVTMARNRGQGQLLGHQLLAEKTSHCNGLLWMKTRKSYHCRGTD